jgi:hypothetical protein
MSHAEFLSWVKFQNKRGSLFTGRRIEQAVANMMALYANANSKNGNGGYEMYDFAPHEEEPAWTLEQAKKEW